MNEEINKTKDETKLEPQVIPLATKEKKIVVKPLFADRRHQEANKVYVKITEIDVCSNCKESWKTCVNNETGDIICANCGALVKPKQA